MKPKDRPQIYNRQSTIHKLQFVGMLSLLGLALPPALGMGAQIGRQTARIASSAQTLTVSRAQTGTVGKADGKAVRKNVRKTVENTVGKKREAGAKDQPTGEKWAVIVGVNEYGDSAPRLRYAVSDANRLYSTLNNPKIGNVQPDHIILLTSKSEQAALLPTRANIVRVLEDMAKRAHKNDQFWFYFAGHGIDDKSKDGLTHSYMLPQNFRLSDLEHTALSTQAVRDVLDKNCQAAQKIVVLDCCHSGAGRGVGAPSLRDVFDAQGMVILAACDVNQSAWEFPNMPDGQGGGGIFTYELVSGLKKWADENHDGNISALEIKDFVVGNVQKEVKTRTPGEQTPQFIIGKQTGDPARIVLTHPVDDGAVPPVIVNDQVAEPKKPLPPALIVALEGAAEAVGPTENLLMQKLLGKGFLLADLRGASILHGLLQDPPKAAKAAGERGARYLLLGTVAVTPNRSETLQGLVSVSALISCRLVDEDGKVIATFTKTSSKPYIAGTEAEAAQPAIADAVQRVVSEMLTPAIKALLTGKPKA